MSRVYVRAKPGRIARVSPQGVYIPSDRYIPTQLTPYLSRLAHHHGDIELLREDPTVAPPRRKKDEDASTTDK